MRMTMTVVKISIKWIKNKIINEPIFKLKFDYFKLIINN